MLLDLNMEDFVLYAPNTRVEKIACYTSLALGLESRIRRSDIGVFPRRSCVLYVPSTRVQRDCGVPYVPGTRVKRCCLPYVLGRRVKEVLCYMSLAQGLMKAYQVCTA